jgi:uncharacterized membrane protein SpoIIM required for sporulation
MSPDEFIASHQKQWRELESLLKRVRDGQVSRLADEELRALGQLYRLTASDLALAQRDFPRHQVTRYLNELVGRTHHQVYQGAPLEARRLLQAAFLGFPVLVRATWRYHALAALLFFGTGLLTFLLTWNSPELVYLLLPPEMHNLVPIVESGKLWTEIDGAQRSLAAASILTNNIQVSFLAFAGGTLLGLLTLYVLIYNGLILGTIFGFVHAHGLGGELGDFVIAHGVVELSVITLAGGAGLMMGYALVAPGLYRRRDAFVLAAQRAVRIIGGCAVLLIFAGMIEGFISPSSLPTLVKILVGLATGALMWAYIAFVGRSAADTEAVMLDVALQR